MPYPSSSSSSSFSSTKTLIRTLFLSQIRRAARALNSAKSFLVEIFQKGSLSPVQLFIYFTKGRKNNKIYLGSFRLHYNWCSSRYWSVQPSVLQDCAATLGPATSQEPWRCSSSAWRQREDEGGDDCYHHEPSGLSGYLRWLEEKRVEGGEPPQKNEIDRLADVFIAKCHEKFILEKQESDRRFHEMLARSM